MKTETSFGIIPLQLREGEWFVLLVQLLSGNHWSFPKGHPNPLETPQQTAERELFEETNLHISEWLNIPPLSESYLHNSIPKTVTYYPAIVKGDVITQPSEISNHIWVLLSAAHQILTYNPSQQLAIQLNSILSKSS
ncbi:MAG: NUDIX domain-containing protein [Parachlamydiales bacterium]|jgi:8-oxo-dGTP pyrophosphatase MutT (NUDIX family)